MKKRKIFVRKKFVLYQLFEEMKKMKLKKIIEKYYIIFIFFLILMPTATSYELVRDTEIIVKQMSTNKTLDINNEIITFISGSFCDYRINKGGLIRDIEFFAGMGGTGLELNGYTRNPIHNFFYPVVHYISAPFFIGIKIHHGGHYGAVRGIALGNIDWE